MSLYSLSPFLSDRLKAALHESICFGCIICWFTFNYTEILMVLCQQFWCSGDLNVSVGHIKNKLLIHMSNGENLPLIRGLTQIVFKSCLIFRWVFFSSYSRTQNKKLKYLNEFESIPATFRSLCGKTSGLLT